MNEYKLQQLEELCKDAQAGNEPTVRISRVALAELLGDIKTTQYQLDNLRRENDRHANQASKFAGALAQANERANHHQAEAEKLRQERDAAINEVSAWKFTAQSANDNFTALVKELETERDAARVEREEMVRYLVQAYELYDSDGYYHAAAELYQRLLVWTPSVKQ